MAFSKEIGCHKDTVSHVVSAIEFPVVFDVLAPVAQLDRVMDFESRGRRFESCPEHIIHFPANVS